MLNLNEVIRDRACSETALYFVSNGAAGHHDPNFFLGSRIFDELIVFVHERLGISSPSIKSFYSLNVIIFELKIIIETVIRKTKFS